MAVYDLTVVARTQRASGPPTLEEIDAIPATELSWTDELSRPSSLQAGCSPGALPESVKARLRSPRLNPVELWLWRDATLVFAGPLSSLQTQGQTLTLTAAGLLEYLRYMWVVVDYDFTQIDQFTIVKTWVDLWQTFYAYGHFGIDTTTVGLSGVVRDGVYKQAELHNVYDRTQDLSARANGFDVTVDPADRKLRLLHPRQGVDRSADVVLDDRNITSPNTVMSLAAADVGTMAWGVGTSPAGAMVSTFYVSTLDAVGALARYGCVGIPENYDGVSELDTLDDHVLNNLRAHNKDMLQPAPQITPVPDADVDDFAVGDVVTYSYDAGLGLQTLVGRVLARTVTVAESGRETMTVQF